MAARIYPSFWTQPIKYLRWASHEKPAIFYSIAIGCLGPVFMVAAPPFRRMIGDQVGRPKVPMTYPIPKGPRVIPEGYDD
ncbi:NADH-ubiquinone oxidoreductase [Saccharata proteae CBS 121410]|uniref:NADH-ubiquinone oxidoreductase n=1 Tax=Saccharata proteae CBS 121410 TaxID=1314787 RepID=A0A9P4HND1_9PEZI|nr:NADH-ubiquinone oxidoreductase [Saccharata proteae CBS 121410]